MKDKDDTIRELQHKLALAELDAEHWRQMYGIAAEHAKEGWAMVKYWQEHSAYWSNRCARIEGLDD